MVLSIILKFSLKSLHFFIKLIMDEFYGNLFGIKSGMIGFAKQFYTNEVLPKGFKILFWFKILFPV